MKGIELDFSGVLDFVSEDEIKALEPYIKTSHDLLHEKTGVGNDFLGWIDLPKNYDREEFSRILKAAKRVKESSDVLVVIGVGGSYLGAKAAYEMIGHNFKNSLSKQDRNGAPEIYFAGQNISSSYMQDLIEVIGDRDFSVNVISKSGTTTEPAIAFRFFKEILEKKYGKKEASKRIFATTDREKGGLKKLADSEEYECFVIPDDIGGRFSVLTPVGLFPLACAGFDVESILRGADEASVAYSNKNLMENDSYIYAAIRTILYSKGKTIEILANFEPRLQYFAEWFKQLFAESEGKMKRGIYPSSANFSTDLHSIGQYIQDGSRILFETFLNIKNLDKDISVNMDEDDVDGLNYLANKGLNYINDKAFEATVKAHVGGGVPCIVINIDRIDEHCFGYLVYFFEKAVAISGYMMGINPFNQPGVEIYKKNMFELLGKPGY